MKSPFLNLNSSPSNVDIRQSLVQSRVPVGIGGYFLKVSFITASRNFRLFSSSWLINLSFINFEASSTSLISSV